MEEMTGLRDRLVDSLVRRGYVTSPSVEDAMKRVPREGFVPQRLRDAAYVDSPLPIGDGQTISAPHMVAIMAEKLEARPGHKVLEVGAGSGYHAAVVAELVRPDGRVFTVERFESLARFAEENLSKAGYSDLVKVVVGDGSQGLPGQAPFDRIFVACGAPAIPSPLIEQLSDDGQMLIPVGGKMYQDLVKVVKRGEKVTTENHGGCVFVPLVGEHGY